MDINIFVQDDNGNLYFSWEMDGNIFVEDGNMLVEKWLVRYYLKWIITY